MSRKGHGFRYQWTWPLVSITRNPCPRPKTTIVSLRPVNRRRLKNRKQTMTYANRKSLYWCFTIHAEDDGELDYDEPHGWALNGRVKYAIWQSELCPNTGREHLQGYMVLHNRVRLSQMKELFHPTCHFEARNGTHSEAKGYCKKPDTYVFGPWEFGSDADVPERAGERSDTKAAHGALQRVRRGELTMEEFADAHFGFYIRSTRGIESYLNLFHQHRPNKAPKLYIFWGPPGTGKSRRAHEMFPTAYRKMKDTWWQGYRGQKTIIFDDYYGWYPYDDLLRICDRYPFTVNFKGGSMPLQADTIVFTSNLPWEKWYSEKIAEKTNDFYALRRRIEEFGEVHHMMVRQYETAAPPPRAPHPMFERALAMANQLEDEEPLPPVIIDGQLGDL